MKKVLSIMLVLAMTLSLCSTAFATEAGYDNVVDEIETVADIEPAKDAYDALTPEAKAVFNEALANDMELLQFHKTYVDPFSDITFVPQQRASVMSVAAASDPMTVLNAQLALLSLPTSVVYTLTAMGAGMVAAIADGPLPIGDILLAAATVSAAVAIAANWNDVSPKWNSVVNAFKKAFAASATNVIGAFQTILQEVKGTLATTPSVTLSGKTITINGVKYTCSTKADSLTEQQKKDKKYFPAVLYNGTVYVDPLHSLTNATAKLFMYANNSKIGIWATSASYARGLCGGNSAIWHNTHSSSEGYFFHYHHPSYKNFHCWYL